MEMNKPFCLYANCIPVKGASRSVICDLQRNQIKLIPNDLFEILDKYEKLTIYEVKKNYQNKYDETIDEYFDFLLENEFIFFTDIPDSFPKLSHKWDDPSEITNAIIDFNNDSNYDIKKAINQLDKLNCKHIEIRFFDNVSKEYISAILKYIEDIKSTILSVDIILPFNFEIEKIESLLNQYIRLSSLKFFNAPKNKFITPTKDKRGYIVYTKEKIQNESHCGIISKNFFVINIPTYTEGKNHNTCLNRKVGIDTKGNIKNCPSMNVSYGNISQIEIKEAIKKAGFKDFWNITKDEIETCKICEFRYVCTDCRAFVKNTLDKPVKCGYDPYTNKWDESSSNILKAVK